MIRRCLTMDATRDNSDSLSRRMLKLAEAAAIVALIGSALVFAALYFHAMATTSLWVDELYTIDRFTSHGPWFVITHYEEPNNHIFFNLINSLLPGAGSVTPLRARMWAFVFVATTLGLMMWAFRRRAYWLGGALAVAVLAGNSEWLDLHLQARGYGITAFCGLAMSIATLRFLETNRSRDLLVIGVCTVLGTWTVPTFVGFAAPLMLLLFLGTRNRHTFLAGALTAAALLLTYAPVLMQLLQQMGQYGAEWGREYSTPAAVPQLLRVFLIHPTAIGILLGDRTVFGFLLVLFFLPYTLWKRQDSTGQGIRMILGAVACLFLICLWLQTPLLRTTSFIVLPIAFCAAHEIGGIVSRIRSAMVLSLLCIVLALLQVQHTWAKIRRFHFVPIENWQGTARYIERTFPDGTPVFVSVGAEFFQKYLAQRFQVSEQFDPAAFTEGRLAAIETDFAPQDGVLFVRLDANAARWAMEARRPHTVWARPPDSSSIQRIDAHGEVDTLLMLDRSTTTCWSSGLAQRDTRHPVELTVSMVPGRCYRSLTLLCPGKKNLPGSLSAKMQVEGRGSVAVAPEDIEQQGNMMTIHLQDHPATAVSLSVGPSDKASPFAVCEMWAYPSSVKTP